MALFNFVFINTQKLYHIFNEFFLLKSENNINNKKKFIKYKFENRILNIFSNKETINTYLGEDKIIKYF